MHDHLDFEYSFLHIFYKDATFQSLAIFSMMDLDNIGLLGISSALLNIAENAMSWVAVSFWADTEGFLLFSNLANSHSHSFRISKGRTSACHCRLVPRHFNSHIIVDSIFSILAKIVRPTCMTSTKTILTLFSSLLEASTNLVMFQVGFLIISASGLFPRALRALSCCK